MADRDDEGALPKWVGDRYDDRHAALVARRRTMALLFHGKNADDRTVIA